MLYEVITEKTLAAWETTYGAENTLLAFPLTSLGEVYRKLGRHPEAIEAAERAEAIRLATSGSAADLAETRFVLAQARNNFV